MGDTWGCGPLMEGSPEYSRVSFASRVTEELRLGTAVTPGVAGVAPEEETLPIYHDCDV